MARLVLTALCSLTLVACTSREVEPSHALPEDEPTTTGGDNPLANDFVRVELREIHQQCADYVAGLEEDVDDAATREDIARIIALATYVAGEVADGSDDAEVMGRTGAAARGCIETPDDYGCGVTPVPSTAAATNSPIHEDTVRTRLTASDHIRIVNGALDALDDFVFSHMNPDRWTAGDREMWDAKTTAAREACATVVEEPTELEAVPQVLP